jgi:hypothetical protein
MAAAMTAPQQVPAATAAQARGALSSALRSRSFPRAAPAAAKAAAAAPATAPRRTASAGAPAIDTPAGPAAKRGPPVRRLPTPLPNGEEVAAFRASMGRVHGASRFGAAAAAAFAAADAAARTTNADASGAKPKEMHAASARDVPDDDDFGAALDISRDQRAASIVTCVGSSRPASIISVECFALGGAGGAEGEDNGRWAAAAAAVPAAVSAVPAAAKTAAAGRQPTALELVASGAGLLRSRSSGGGRAAPAGQQRPLAAGARLLRAVGAALAACAGAGAAVAGVGAGMGPYDAAYMIPPPLMPAWF